MITCHEKFRNFNFLQVIIDTWLVVYQKLYLTNSKSNALIGTTVLYFLTPLPPQIESWIDEIGEPFLREHIDTGSSLEETEKYCNEFTTFLDEVSLISATVKDLFYDQYISVNS